MPSIGSYLQSAFGSNAYGNMRSHAHASRLYVDNIYALAPKTGWIYYVVFTINPNVYSWLNTTMAQEVGMLVKSTDLPRFKIKTDVVNQYNRKTVVHTGVSCDPISMILHDDHSNTTHQMWLDYYIYHYGEGIFSDRTHQNACDRSALLAFEPYNQYNAPVDGPNSPKLGLNSGNVTTPFFDSITIYQLNQQRFTSFKLVNPQITEWSHDKVDQSAITKFAESKMSIAYESVFYGAGHVAVGNPTGFATFHYDNTPSPLSIAGGGNSSIAGPGGIVDGATSIFGAIGALSPSSTLGNYVNIGISSANLLGNLSNVTNVAGQAQQVILSALSGNTSAATNALGLSGIINSGASALTGLFNTTVGTVATPITPTAQMPATITTTAPAPAATIAVTAPTGTQIAGMVNAAPGVV